MTLPPNGGVRSIADVRELVNYLREYDGPAAVDTETTGLRPYDDDRLRGISVATEDGYWYVNHSHPSGGLSRVDLVLPVLATMPLVFHHAVFDWAFIAEEFGVDLRAATVWDTQVANWLLDENLKTGLKESCSRIFGYDAAAERKALKAITKETGRTWETFTFADIADYAADDARLTLDLFNWQQEHFDTHAHGAGLFRAMRREMKVQDVVYAMNRRGIGIDREKLAASKAKVEQSISEQEEFFKAQDVLPSSPKQVGHWLYDKLGWSPSIRTKTGARSTDKATLKDLADHGCDEASLLLEYRHAFKELTAYYEPLDRYSQSGSVHPHFSSTRTVTGRLSCSGPNLQTIPRGDVMGDVRACFKARPGWELWEFDLSQAELKVIAGYAKEQVMIDALEAGRDLHDETAEAVFGVDFTPLQRRFAKNLNYGFPYYIGPAKFATYISPVPTDQEVSQAASILAGYRRAYPNIVRTMDKLERYASEHGELPLGWPGRYRRFRGPGYMNGCYTAFNAIVQGGIGEFMKDVMIYPGVTARDDQWRLCLQIHDALVFEVRPGMAEHLHLFLQTVADKVNPFTMRMTWDVKEWSDHE